MATPYTMLVIAGSLVDNDVSESFLRFSRRFKRSAWVALYWKCSCAVTKPACVAALFKEMKSRFADCSFSLVGLILACHTKANNSRKLKGLGLFQNKKLKFILLRSKNAEPILGEISSFITCNWYTFNKIKKNVISRKTD